MESKGIPGSHYKTIETKIAQALSQAPHPLNVALDFIKQLLHLLYRLWHKLIQIHLGEADSYQLSRIQMHHIYSAPVAKSIVIVIHE